MNTLRNSISKVWPAASRGFKIIAFLFFALCINASVFATTETRSFNQTIYPQIGYPSVTIEVSYSPDTIIDGWATFQDTLIDDLEIDVSVVSGGMAMYVVITRTDNSNFDGTEGSPVVCIGSTVIMDLGKQQTAPQVTIVQSGKTWKEAISSQEWALNAFPNPVIKGGTVHLQEIENATSGILVRLSDGAQFQISLSEENTRISLPESLEPGLYQLMVWDEKGALLGKTRISVLDYR